MRGRRANPRARYAYAGAYANGDSRCAYAGAYANGDSRYAYDSADTHAAADCDRNGRPYAHADYHAAAAADPYPHDFSVTDASAVGWRGLDRVQRVCGP
jgi:hypothetical protein